MHCMSTVLLKYGKASHESSTLALPYELSFNYAVRGIVGGRTSGSDSTS